MLLLRPRRRPAAPPEAPPEGGKRRGSALMLTMIFTFALGGLAISAIYMSGSTQILSKLYDRERDYRYAAEWALQIGKSRITTDTSLHLPDSLYVQLMNGQTVLDAQSKPVPKVKVDLYAGVGGSSTGQYGRFVELISVAYDNGGARHVRRLELQAENFARFAMFVDQWPGACYTTGEIVRGRAHSNQGWQSCSSSPGPVYTDTVSAVNSITGTAQYQSAKWPSAPVIPFPTVAKLSWMPGYASSANLSYTPQGFTGTTGGSRMEFAAVDLDGDGALTGAAEGYFRIFEPRIGTAGGANPYANPTNANATFVVANVGTDSSFSRMGTAPGSQIEDLINAGGLARSVIQNQCGVWYTMGNPQRPQFVPLAVHDTLNLRYKWIVDSLVQPPIGQPQVPNRFANRAQALTYVHNIKSSALNQTLLLRNGSAQAITTGRCYPAGDPRLMPTERPSTLPIVQAWHAPQSIDTLHDNMQRGGEDTTFTAVTKTGSWRQWPGWTGSSFFTPGVTRRQSGEERYLWPVHRTQNLNSKGIIYVNGSVWLSGVFRGRATLYVKDDIKFIDDLTYVTNPASLPICQNLLGIITGDDILISDNNINRPRWMDNTTAGQAKFLDDNQDFFLHAVTLSGVNSANGTFGVENLSSGPNAQRLCTPVPPYSAQTSGGCINQAGGVIERVISATFASNYTGFAENRVKDACLDIDSPPYFPLTGRYKDNEFYELDPNLFSQIGVANFYRRLQSG
jgi:hypothetical protein